MKRKLLSIASIVILIGIFATVYLVHDHSHHIARDLEVLRDRTSAPARRQSAMLDLVHAGPGAIKDICTLQNNDEPEIRRLAVVMLGAIGDQSNAIAQVVDPIRSALSDSSPRVREQAAIVLTRFGPAAAPAVPELTKTLVDVEPKVRDQSALALGAIGTGAEPAIPALIAALNSEDGVVASHAAAALGQIGKQPDVVVPALMRAMQTSAQLLRASNADIEEVHQREIIEFNRMSFSVLEALGRFGPAAQSAVPALTPFLHGDQDIIRIRTAWAIWLINGKNDPVVPVLVDTLQKGNAMIRMTAAETLGNIGPAASAAIPALTAAEKDGDEMLQKIARDAVQKIGNANTGK